MIPADLRAYQAAAGLVVDGVLGPITRAALLADEMATHISDLIGFRGSLGLIIECEGFKGRPYWPGGQSGVTLDYGWDLAGQSRDALELLYGHLWPPDAFGDLYEAVGLRGEAARDWAKAHDYPYSTTTSMHGITREQAAKILPRAAGPYWHAAVRACPALRDAPPRVQTALLSVTYSAWVGPVQEAAHDIMAGQWGRVGAWVRACKGSKGRREIEARLIESVKEGV